MKMTWFWAAVLSPGTEADSISLVPDNTPKLISPTEPTADPVTLPEQPEAGGQRHRWLIGMILLLVAVFVILGALGRRDYANVPSTGIYDASVKRSDKLPELATETVVDNLDLPWDLVFLPDDSMLFTSKGGGLFRAAAGQSPVSIFKPTDLLTAFEGGMMGLEVDPNFASNRFAYVCMLSRQTSGVTDVRLMQLKLSNDLSKVEDRKDIVTGIPANNIGELGRHSGCRPKFGPDGNLWIGTGDAAMAATSQDPAGLGGKILRVNRSGQGVSGNLKAPYDPRIYSYGHRNVQGLAFWPDGDQANNFGVSLEHGTDRDDELNVLSPGNFGWDPIPAPYNESKDMTDTAKFPDAVSPIWKSGLPTIAPSGGTFVTGEKWQGYDRTLFAGILKGEHVHVFFFNEERKLVNDVAILGEFGRIRTVVESPAGDIYLLTSNGGSKDKIIRVTPKD